MSTTTQSVAGAMDVHIMAQEIAARNIANVATPGFKRNFALIETVSQSPSGSAADSPGGSPVITGIGLDLSQGSLQSTSNDMDFAIQGEGYFTISTPNGLRYTRNGSFRLNENRMLVTQSGDPVMGENGELRIPEGVGKLAVSSDGQLSFGAAGIGRLKIAAFDKPEMLRQTGDSQYIGDAAGARDAGAFTVHQGFVEGSNVQPVTELVSMMATFRDYQACARSLKSIEDSANQLYAWARS